MATALPLIRITTRFGIGLTQGCNELILFIRKLIAASVGRLAVLIILFVQSAHKEHYIGLRSRFGGLLAQRMAIDGRIEAVPFLIGDLGLIAEVVLDTFPRQYFVFDFQLRAAASAGHHLFGIFAYDQYFPRLFGVKRQQIAFVFQQDDAFLCNTAGGQRMFFRGEGAVGSVGIHRGAEGQTQDPPHFFIHDLFVDFALF